MAKKTFKDNPALQFISTAEEEEQEVTPAQEAPTTAAKAPEGYDRVKKEAKKSGLSVNEYVHRILDEATKREE